MSAIIGAFTVLFMLLSPAIREQATAFREQAPQSLADLRAAWQESGNALLAGPGQQLLGRGIAFIESPDQAQGITVPQGAALGLLTGLGGGIIGLVTVLIISFYYLMEKSWIRRIVLLDSAPETRIRVSRIWDEVEQKVGDWLRGQLTLCLVIGVTATIGYALLGIQFWPLLGLWAGITEIIPILGPWLGGIPAVIIALTQGWEKALLVIGFVVLLQLTENAVLVPRVMRGAVGLTPLTVFIAILAGTEFAGIPGALLAIPIAAVIQVMLSHYTEARREAKLAGLSALPGWRWMRGSISPPAFSPLAPETSSDGGPTRHHRKRRTAHRDGAPMCSLAPPAATRDRVWTRAAARDDVAADTGREAPVGESALDTTSDHVARNREQLERLRRLVARLGDDDLRRELPDGWTVADALAHLAFYDRRAQIFWSDSRAKVSLPRPTITRRSTPPCRT